QGVFVMNADTPSAAARSVWTAAALFAVLQLAAPAHAQLQFTTADGKQSFKIGLLGQFQGEAIDSATTSSTSKNLFIRRLRVLGSFKLSDKLGVFFETDAPNLGKDNPDGSKNAQDLFLQDVHVTYTQNEQFNIDAGMMMLAPSYNHQQSAATFM